MARTEKHKTKYKEPKDYKKSQKAETRKDIKDYTHDDKDGGMNPNSTKEKQQKVLRKRDKQVIDNAKNMVPNKKDVADYYKVEGDHDPKYTAKERAKLQDEDEKTSKDEIKDKIENLTREQKERLVREYVRRKIKKVLAEKKNAKPDFLDLDDDGNKTEPMKKAAKDAKNKKAKNEQEEPEEAPADAAPDAAPEEAPEEEGGEEEVEGGEETTDTDTGGAAVASPSPSPTPPPAEPKATDDVAAAENSAESDEQETEDEILDDTLSKEQKKKKAIMKQSLAFQKSDTGRTSADAIKPIIDLGIDNLDAENQKSFYLTLKKLADKNLRA